MNRRGPALSAAAVLALFAAVGCPGGSDDVAAPDGGGRDARPEAEAAPPEVEAGGEAGDAADAGDGGGDAADAGDAGDGGCNGPACDWTQWAHDARHTGSTPAIGQAPSRVLAKIVFDPFVAAEQAESGGDLLAHFQTPLLVGDDVYMLTKAGTYVPCAPPGSGHLADGGVACGPAAWDGQVWTEKRFHWEGGQLVEKWTFESDWKPEPAALVGSWEPVFQPAVAGGVLWVPGAGGALWKLDRTTGATLAHVQPFGAPIDPHMYVAGPLTVDPAGNVVYVALRLDAASPFADATGRLVVVAPDGSARTATYASLVPGAPAPGDPCPSVFTPAAGYPLPYPPPPDDAGAPARPPTVPCLSQRPAINLAPAVRGDGTIVTVSRAHGEPHAGYVVATNPDLSPRWAAPLANVLDDGCGVLEPSQADALADGGLRGYGCRRGATVGVDPETNANPSARVEDLSSSTPVVLPDDSVVYGGYTDYNGARGHLVRFDASGKPAGAFDFGWDVTPAVFGHDGTYSVVTKDNHYFNWGTSALGPYGITRLDATLHPEWSYANTNSMSCHRDADGGVTCVSDHPYGFEWCVNAPAVDARGVVYANSEDGNLYVVGADGGLASQTFLELALGAAYTPIALDGAGRIYALNGGTMRVLGE